MRGSKTKEPSEVHYIDTGYRFKSKKMRAQTCWVIKDPEGKIKVDTARETRQECIKDYDERVLMYTWEQVEQMGYSCVEVFLIEPK